MDYEERTNQQNSEKQLGEPMVYQQEDDLFPNPPMKIYLEGGSPYFSLPSTLSKQTFLPQVIFIPKPSKLDYTDPRAYRPISLTSLVLKTLERLILRHLSNDHDLIDLLSPYQYGFQPGHNTELVISTVLQHLETAKKGCQQAIAIFMDIKGQFDNINMTHS